MAKTIETLAEGIACEFSEQTGSLTYPDGKLLVGIVMRRVEQYLKEQESQRNLTPLPKMIREYEVLVPSYFGTLAEARAFALAQPDLALKFPIHAIYVDGTRQQVLEEEQS